MNDNNFIPTYTLNVYKQEHTTNFYIEIHNVIKTNTCELKLGAGKPLAKKTLRNLIGAVMNEENETPFFSNKLIAENILSCEPTKHRRHIMWYDKPGPKELLFSNSVKLKNNSYSMPGLLYFMHIDKLYVFSFKGRSKPTERTKLYHAPLFNMIGKYTFCWGNVKRDSSDIKDINSEINYWTNLLWNSMFNSDGVQVCKGNLDAIYRNIAGGKEKFPTKSLLDTKLTVGDLLKKLK